MNEFEYSLLTNPAVLRVAISPDETAIVLTLPSSSLLIRLLKVEGGAAG